LVYHCVDDLSAIPGIEAEAFIAKEKDLLYEANVVFTTSKKLFEKCSAINRNTHDFPNVVDWDHFSKAFIPGPDPDDLKEIPHPRLGYVGVLSDFKVDFELLLNIARERTDWHIVLIGEEREGQNNPILHKLKEMKNVHHLGYKKYEELPNYMRGFDVGLLPTLLNSYTSSMFPMKFYEYVSAGLPTAITALNFLNQTPYEGITYKGINEFRFAIENSIASSKLSKQAAFLIVGDNTWELRLNKMLTHI
jgi:glycosyltransferase involved in cell wall biosynthesis